MKGSSIVKLCIGLLIAAIGLYFFLRDVDTKQLVHELQRMSIFSGLVSSGFLMLSLYLRGLRWKAILPHTSSGDKNNLFYTTTIGFMMNNIFPARIGEAVRALLLWKKNGYSFMISFGSLILERVIDLIVLLSFFILPAFLLKQLSHIKWIALVALSGCLFTLFTAGIYIKFEKKTIAIGKWFITFAPSKIRSKITLILKELVLNLQWLHNPKQFLYVISLSVATLLCYPLMIMALTGNSSMHFGILESMFAQAFAAFGAAIPLAPGYVGTIHAVMLQGLTLLGMEQNQARALTIIFHAVNYIVINIFGLFFLFQMKLSFSELFSLKRSVDTDKG